ncbi:ABC transporter ATP-binding protein [Prevotella intermedia]|uniref:ABC transporter ATP-binding protein n=1 Tax=Prevotella intermedia TaxID=28131 RepID=A0AAJ3RT40_PREIN|nr:AAA family ATPase [Prevotella intermedia]PJI20451.1 ABC transporter ATP-binding protein [Prevotella intermedia]
MEMNEFKQVLKNNVSELIALQEQCQNTDVKCAQSILNTILWVKEINEDIEGEIIPSSYDNILINSFDFLSPMMDVIRQNIRNNTIEKIENLDKFFLSQIVANIDSYHFYKSLGFAQENTVVVGANGCGKTTLANTLQKSLNVKDGIVIPAQKLLIIPTFSSTPNYAATAETYNQYQRTILDDKQTFNASKEDDIPWGTTQQYGSEFKKVLATLYSERMAKRNKFCDAYERGEELTRQQLQSALDVVINIWNFLIEHRTLQCDDSNNLVLTGDGVNGSYPAFQMSDGERIILYLVGRGLLAPERALIIIDEPEMYLHKTIVDKLWNKLEWERRDCVFLYLTHDLQFAASRDAKKCWIRSFEYPSKWNIEEIQDNVIPEELLLKLLGSRKKILFCEGKRNSLDSKIFELLFEDYTITPVETCKDVINFTKAFNKIPNTVAKAYGIIDRDFHSEDQLEKLKQQNVFSYGVAEIENLFLLPDVITGFAKYKNEECDIEDIETRILNKFEQDKQTQISQYVSSAINAYFKASHISVGNKKEEVEQNFQNFMSEVDINKLFNERESYINDVIANKKYKKAIMLYNNKGLHSVIEKYFNMGDYRHRALDYLRGTKEIESIKRIFPDQLWNAD